MIVASPWKAMPMVPHTRTPAPGEEIIRQIHAPDHQGGGVGHNLPQEAPQAFAEAVIDVDQP